MAVIENSLKKSIVLEMADYSSLSTEPTFKRYSYQNVKNSATSTALFTAGVAISNLYDGTVSQLNTLTTHRLSQA